MNITRTKGDKVFDTIIIIIVSVILFLFPLLNVLASSFSSADAIVAGKVGIFPQQFTLNGYKQILQNQSIWKGFWNSIKYTFIGTIIQVTCQMLCAYPLSRKDFKGRKFLNLFLVLTMFISGGMIPTYLLITQLHLYNTMWAIILPGCISVFNIIVIRTYMESSIPKELQEAAMIDGCSIMQIYFKIVFPVIRPIIMTVAILNAMWIWNDYLLPYLVIGSEYKTISVAIQYLRGGYGSIDLGLMMSMLVLAIIPIVIFYMICQKWIIQGVIAGAVKG